MRAIGYLALGIALVATPAFAVDKGGASAGTLARQATPARAARLAEIAKDATPPKVGKRKGSSDYRKVSDNSVRIPIGR